jgi:glutamine amidotransferase
MIKASVVVADYGSGNILSVARAFEYLGASVKVSSDARDMQKADRVVVPGVGSFGNGMAKIRDLGMDEAIKEISYRERPLLGLCVGMQLLFEGGDEFGTHYGLGLIPGWVKRIPSTDLDGGTLKVPHIGWAQLVFPSEKSESSPGGLLKGIPLMSSVYFVHSFAPVPSDPTHILSYCRFGGHLISAAVQKGNTFGCQFHPERSGKVGLGILGAFLEV